MDNIKILKEFHIISYDDNDIQITERLNLFENLPDVLRFLVIWMHMTYVELQDATH